MRVLVTGATGFVGVNYLHEHADDGHEYVALVRPGGPTDRLPESVETVRGDVLDSDSLADALAECDAVCHLAAAVYPQADMTRLNVEGTENLIAAADAAGVERVVFTSTIAAHPGSKAAPTTTYQTSKAEADRRFFEADHGFEYAVVYPTYVVGPRDYRLTRYEHFRPVASNRVLVPPLYAYADYNIVHVADVADALAFCLDGDGVSADGERHVVSGENVGHVAVLRAIADSLGGDCRVVDVPYPLAKYAVAPAIDLAHRWGVSPVGGSGFVEREDYGTVHESFAERIPTGAAPRHWTTALADTADWYREVGVL